MPRYKTRGIYHDPMTPTERQEYNTWSDGWDCARAGLFSKEHCWQDYKKGKR